MGKENLVISNIERNEVWKKYFQNYQNGYDIFGNYVSKNNFEIDHIYPKSLNGSDLIENLLPLSPISNTLKSYHLFGKINGRMFKVKKIRINNMIVGIIHINNVLIN